MLLRLKLSFNSILVSVCQKKPDVFPSLTFIFLFLCIIMNIVFFSKKIFLLMIDQLFFSDKIDDEMVMNLLTVVSVNLTMTHPSNSSSIIFSVLFGIGLSLLALITALGNIIVLLAFYYDKKLRTINGKSTNSFEKINSFFFEKRLFYIKYGYC